jgi:glycosyltransferase involved in cell wall biosynthesis
VKRADVVFACSEHLAHTFSDARRGVHFEPNGVDLERFMAPTEVPADIAGLPRPIFGYVGVIQERLDVGAVARLAAENPDASVVLVGPVLAPRHLEPLRSCANVHVLGPRHHSLVPAYISAFDVCLVPHVTNALTISMNPLKVYEYLAAGRPVVASGLAGFEDADELIVRAEGPADFALRARAQLGRESSASSLARRTYASKHSWTERVEEMLAVVDDALVEHGAG